MLNFKEFLFKYTICKDKTEKQRESFSDHLFRKLDDIFFCNDAGLWNEGLLDSLFSVVII